MATAKLSAVIETKGAAKAERELNSIAKNAKVVDINVKKTEKTFKSFGQNASKAVAAIDGPLGGISSRISAITSLASGGAIAFAGLAAGITGAAFATVAGIRALDEYNVSLKRVEATIKATGEGVGFTGEQLQKTAEELAIATLTSVDAVQKAQAQLLTFNRVLGAEFTKAIALSQDLAEAGFGTIESNAVLLGKALQDPITGMSALTRVGVTLTEQQKELARSAVETGDVFEAQRIILGAVASQVEGVGAAVAAGTLAGELDTAGIAIDRFTRAFTESSGALSVWQQIVKGVGVQANNLAAILEGPTADDLFAKSLETSIALSEAQEKLGEILNKNSNQYRRQEAIVGRLRQENQEAIRLASEAAELENKKIIAQGVAAKKEVEARRKIQEELKAEAELKQIAIDGEQLQKQIALQDSARKQLEIIEAANDSELEAIKRKEDEKLELIQGYLDDGLIKEQEYEDAKTEIKAKGDAERKKIDDKTKQDDEKNQKAIVDQRKKAGSDVVSNLRGALGESSALYKAAAITETTINTYASATAAYKALAGIPVVGPALGAAAAGVAVGAGLANVQRISSAREQGGSLSSGQTALVGERGPEIITTQQNARVLNASQTRGAMNSGGGANVSLVVIDQSTGSKQFDQETQDDGRIVLLIRDTVSNDFTNPNSQITKGATNGLDVSVRR